MAKYGKMFYGRLTVQVVWRRLNMFDRFSVILNKGENFRDFPFAFSKPSPIWKAVYYKRKDIFVIKETPFQKGRKQYWQLPPYESVQIPLKSNTSRLIQDLVDMYSNTSQQ